MSPDFWMSLGANAVLIIGAGLSLRVSIEHRLTRLESHLELMQRRQVRKADKPSD